MKKLLILNLLLLVSITFYGQINMSDSTVQVIGYWNNNEMQSYLVTQESFKVKDTDTTERQFFKYEVDVKIIDSTANSYTIEWFYHDYEIQTENAFVEKLSSIMEDIKVVIKTDELGTLIGVENWEEIREVILKATGILKAEFKEIPQFDQIVTQVENMYQTKESIEAGVIFEIIQFYNFHGAQYELHETYTGKFQLPNLYGGEPFDTDFEIWLDEIVPEENNYIIRMKQTVDSEQLLDATLKYLGKMAETLGGEQPTREDISELKNETWLASVIHGSGWIIYSIETKETSADNVLKVQERIIELQ